MLNRVILMGRITQDLEIRQTQGGVAVLSFTVAVDRGYVKQGEERQTDFINCVAWRQQAEFISRYFAKGRLIAIEGNLRTRTYDDKNGVKHYVTEVFVDNVSFTGEKAASGSSSSSYSAQTAQNLRQQNHQPAEAPAAAQGDPSLSIGGLGEFEEILGDDGVPF